MEINFVRVRKVAHVHAVNPAHNIVASEVHGLL